MHARLCLLFLSRWLTGWLTGAAAVPEPLAYSGQDGLYNHPGLISSQ